MGVDSEVIFYDSLGIFPKLTESADDFLFRAQSLTRQDMDTDYARIIAQRGGLPRRELHRLSPSLVAQAAKRIEKRFGCDTSWVNVYCAHYGFDPFVGPNYGGFATRIESVRHNERGVFFPPLIFMNIECLSMGDLEHELLHIPRNLALPDITLYAIEQDKYEERFADSTRFVRPIIHNVGTQARYIHGRAIMQRSIGSLADFVMIRTPYDELKEFFIERSLASDPIQTIKRVAQHSLRYQIIAERLGL